jgi:peptidyl-prolyl cis-trans isomerase B (cyclophilin B)
MMFGLRNRAIALVSTFAIALALPSVSAQSSFADSKSSSKVVIASKESAKEKESAKKKMAVKPLCAATTSVAHKAPVVNPPAVKLPVKNRTFTFETNCGQIVVEADGDKAPLTTLALTALIKGGFYNKTLCHRLTTAGLFVIQCGDPTATGSGGPLFSYRDENLPEAGTNDYPAGTVAMANSGANTNGSQFFLVYADTTLNPYYTRWGKIVKGLDILKAVAAQGVVGGGTDGTPKQTIAIERVTVK